MKNIIILFLFIFSISLYSENFFIEDNSIVNNNKIDKNIKQIIIEHLYKGDKVYVIGNRRDKAKEQIIKNELYLKHFRYSFIAKIYLFFNKKSFVYVSSEKFINYLFNKKYKYINVLYESSEISSINLLTLTDKNNAKIFLTELARSKLNIPVDKNKIIVIDGDTFIYENTRYRLLGVDAAEIAQSPYGEYGSNFVYTKIKNSKNVYFKTADIDIYGRVLTHIIIDGTPLSFMLMENKLAIQTVTTYGDNGYPDIALGIVERAKKQGRLKFKKPSSFRKEERTLNSYNENETDESVSIKKTQDKKTNTAKKYKSTKKKKIEIPSSNIQEIKEYKKIGYPRKYTNTNIDDNSNSQNITVIPEITSETDNTYSNTECSQINILINLLKEKGFIEIETDDLTNTIIMKGSYDKLENINIDRIEVLDEHSFFCKCHNYQVLIIEKSIE